MAYNEDNFGIELKGVTVTMMTAINWGEVLSKVNDNAVTISTFGKPHWDFYKYIKNIENITCLFGYRHESEKDEITKKITGINANCKLHFKKNTHAKIVLIAPDEVYLSSQNMWWPADYLQHTIYIKNKKVYEVYKKNFDNYVEHGYTGNKKQSKDNSRVACAEPDYNFVSKGIVAATPKMDIKAEKIKCSYVTSWPTKFNGYNNRSIIITTYTLPDTEEEVAIIKGLLRRNNVITIYANSLFKKDGNELIHRIKSDGLDVLNLDIKYLDNIHAKMILVDDNIVWLSSHNFGNSSYFENTIQIYDKQAYKYYKNALDAFLATTDVVNKEYANQKMKALGITY